MFVYYAILILQTLWDEAPKLLILAEAAHILQERYQGFAREFNEDFLLSRDPNFPVGPKEAFFKDQLGLFLTKTLLLVASIEYPHLFWIVVGFDAADIFQHLAISIWIKRVSAGMTSCALIVGCLSYLIPNALENFDLVSLFLGVIALVVNITIAEIKLIRKH